MTPQEKARKLKEKARKLRPFIVKSSASLSDADALEAVDLYDIWKPDTEYPKDKRLQHLGVLYRVQQKHTSQAIYPPGATGTESLYTEVPRPGQGDDVSNPIPYNNNMELFEGKYYSQDGTVYYCFRSTGVAVYNPLSALIEIYVRVAV